MLQLAEKTRNGAQVKKRYHKPLTPCDRLLTDARMDKASCERIVKLRTDLDPVRLLAEIRSAQQALVTLADAADEAWIAASRSEPLAPLDEFVSGLRTAWQDGEVRPTSQPKPKAKRGRRRPDPLAAVTDDLRWWFDADPSLSGRQLFDRLQARHPGQFQDGLVRTVQRRLKIWRSALAHELVFGRDRASGVAAPPQRRVRPEAADIGLKVTAPSSQSIRLARAWRRARHRQGMACRRRRQYRGRSDGQP